ncbi:MAG TPA: DinB family protein [Verrucomicrobiae bacterium]|nr:DinB family protein [Verrucomicrobiae bacterium]
MTKTLLTLWALAMPAISQTTIKDAMIKHWKATGELTLAVAEAMPAADYNFRPNPEEMSFGQLMAHIGGADRGACANASGMTPPAYPEKIAAYAKDTKLDVDKESAITFLKQTFDFCNKAVASVTLEQLDKVAGPPARNLTGYEWLWSYFTHTAHHRGQAEVYLRVKGIKPPTYVF